MNKPLFYRLNIWIAEQLKTTAPNLYKYKTKFADSGAATFEMFWKAGLIAFAIGLLLGIILVVTKRGGIRRNPVAYHLTNTIVNVFRSIPFIILGVFFLVWAFKKKIPARAVHPEQQKPKKETTHYAKPVNQA